MSQAETTVLLLLKNSERFEVVSEMQMWLAIVSPLIFVASLHTTLVCLADTIMILGTSNNLWDVDLSETPGWRENDIKNNINFGVCVLRYGENKENESRKQTEREKSVCVCVCARVCAHLCVLFLHILLCDALLCQADTQTPSTLN